MPHQNRHDRMEAFGASVQELVTRRVELLDELERVDAGLIALAETLITDRPARTADAAGAVTPTSFADRLYHVVPADDCSPQLVVEIAARFRDYYGTPVTNTAVGNALERLVAAGRVQRVRCSGHVQGAFRQRG